MRRFLSVCFLVFLDFAVLRAQVAAPLNRVVVSASPGGFIDSTTQQPFYPEGNNYIYRPLCEFNVGLYDSAKAEASLALMERNGYNVVRIFIGFAPCFGPGGPYFGIGGSDQTSTPDLYAPYLENIRDFITKATQHRIYVIPVLTFVPYTAYYLAHFDSDDNVTGVNRFYLNTHGVEGKREYARRFVRAIASFGLLSGIFAYELENEVEFSETEAPFSRGNIRVKTADGNIYDMKDPIARKQCMDANLVHWANAVSGAIREVDPQAMTTASVFTRNAVKASPWRVPARPLVINLFAKGLSYIDIHLYPTGSSYKIDEDLASSEMPLVHNQPVLLGEFGALDQAYRTIAAAAKALISLRERAYQRGIAGSLLWTWDRPHTLESPLYSAMEAGGVINDAIAPAHRVTSTSSLRGTYPYLATDAREATSWIARTVPAGNSKEWIQIDLGRTRRIARVELVVEQDDEGQTIHEVWGGATEPNKLLKTFQGRTRSGQRLQANFAERDLRYIRIITTKSNSRFGWREIAVK